MSADSLFLFTELNFDWISTEFVYGRFTLRHGLRSAVTDGRVLHGRDDPATTAKK